MMPVAICPVNITRAACTTTRTINIRLEIVRALRCELICPGFTVTVFNKYSFFIIIRRVINPSPDLDSIIRIVHIQRGIIRSANIIRAIEPQRSPEFTCYAACRAMIRTVITFSRVIPYWPTCFVHVHQKHISGHVGSSIRPTAIRQLDRDISIRAIAIICHQLLVRTAGVTHINETADCVIWRAPHVFQVPELDQQWIVCIYVIVLLCFRFQLFPVQEKAVPEYCWFHVPGVIQFRPRSPVCYLNMPAGIIKNAIAEVIIKPPKIKPFAIAAVISPQYLGYCMSRPTTVLWPFIYRRSYWPAVWGALS